MLTDRRRAKRRNSHAKPTTYAAEKAYEVWSWDISYSVPGIRHLHGEHKRITNLSQIYAFEAGAENV